jgi:5-methylcytosine-specific restriction protein B
MFVYYGYNARPVRSVDLISVALIGMGDWKEGESQRAQFMNDMKVNDIVAIKNGGQLIALVQVTGNYFHESKPDDELDWFEHRRQISILAWHEGGEQLPQPRGTLNRCVDLSNSTSQMIIKWHKQVLRELAMTEHMDLLTHQKQIILYGPPGTGKTRQAKILAKAMVCGQSESDISFEEKRGVTWNIVQFHPAYNYEDFVRGVRVKTQSGSVTYVTENGIFGIMARDARLELDTAKLEKREAKHFVLIIDEINRANLASVLGELIYGLEYRDESVDTPYELEGNGEKDRSITVPDNLLIIGTMNTADRSIGHIDYAIRRRFAFVECQPNESALENYYTDKSEILKIKAIGYFKTVFGLFENKDANEKATLSSDFLASDVRLGHSYFMANDDKELERKLRYQVKPILNEYLRDGVLTESAREVIEKLNS